MNASCTHLDSIDLTDLPEVIAGCDNGRLL
jgi:hypothetical protein